VQVFRIRIQSGRWILFRIQEGKNDTQKQKKRKKDFRFWGAGCYFLRAEDISSSLDILYGGLGISKLQFWPFFSPVILFFKYWSIGYLNPGSGPKMKAMQIRNIAALAAGFWSLPWGEVTRPQGWGRPLQDQSPSGRIPKLSVRWGHEASRVGSSFSGSKP
jgi:hypothetical protein